MIPSSPVPLHPMQGARGRPVLGLLLVRAPLRIQEKNLGGGGKKKEGRTN